MVTAGLRPNEKRDPTYDPGIDQNIKSGSDNGAQFNYTAIASVDTDGPGVSVALSAPNDRAGQFVCSMKSRILNKAFFLFILRHVLPGLFLCVTKEEAKYTLNVPSHHVPTWPIRTKNNLIGLES